MYLNPCNNNNNNNNKETSPQLVLCKIHDKRNKPVSLVSDIRVVAPPLPRLGHESKGVRILKECVPEMLANLIIQNFYGD